MSEEKKFTLEEVENLLDEESGEKSSGILNFQTIFAVLVLNWQWFLHFADYLYQRCSYLSALCQSGLQGFGTYADQG